MCNLEIAPYHTLCLYVEYAVLCGNKVFLNFLNFEKILNFFLKGNQYMFKQVYMDDLVQDCIISSSLAMEILQFCARPSVFIIYIE